MQAAANKKKLGIDVDQLNKTRENNSNLLEYLTHRIEGKQAAAATTDLIASDSKSHTHHIVLKEKKRSSSPAAAAAVYRTSNQQSPVAVEVFVTARNKPGGIYPLDKTRQRHTSPSPQPPLTVKQIGPLTASLIAQTTTNKMVDTKSNGGAESPNAGSHQKHQQHQDSNPRKDHYSYTYTYKTADPESGIPGLSSVEVNESVTEEIGPDGSKIIRRHQQEKQINKITQVVTQRVIKRQYIDPVTGQIIEYDPKNELFANLPPETVFEEHTIISDDANATPVVTTTTFSKSAPSQNGAGGAAAAGALKWTNVSRTSKDQLPLSFQEMNLNDPSHRELIENVNAYASQQSASFRIKSHPEDNQGYPEERNMDYDPDDCYPDDDLPYEGLLQPPPANGRSGSGGSTSGGSSSSPVFDTNNTIDLPLITTQTKHYQSSSKLKVTHQHQHQQQTQQLDDGYAVAMPSPNMGAKSKHHHQQQQQLPPPSHHQQQQQQIYQQSSKYSSVTNAMEDPYGQHHQYHQVQGSQMAPQSVHHQSNIYQKTPCSPANDYEGTGIVVGGWRNPTLPEVIEYLGHSSNEIKANAAAYLQHLCYQDDGIKAETRVLDGISKLVALLNSEVTDVYRNACGALRNLSYGKTNDENKLEIKDRGGIPALIRLLRRTQDETVRETITAVLWNLSSCEEIKEPILHEGLHALVKYIVVPYSSLEILQSGNNSNQRTSSMSAKNSQRALANDYSNYPTVLTNATGVLRNCSSNLQFSNCYEARKKLRECEGLIEALLRIVDQAVEPYLNDGKQQKQQQIVNLDLVVKDNMNSKCVENCMCILRNLSFRLQEIVDPNYDRDVKPMPSDEKTTKCVGGKKKKNFEEEFLAHVYPYNMPVPQEGKPQELLWSLVTLNKYLIIIKESTVRDTIEAAVGCLQNLTACYWRPSVVIRQEIRKLKGLPTLVHLLKSEEYEDEPIVSVTSIALRNLAIDAKNKELIGKYAMKDLVAKLPDPAKPMPVRLSVLNEDTITAALACINECIKSSDEFVKSCYNEGGVKRMVYITRNEPHFPIKIVKYAAHVLASMWKHKNLHDLLKKDGYKETDFTSVAKKMGLKSQNSSPVNTLHRPRGDVNVKPSQHGQVQKKKSNGKATPGSGKPGAAGANGTMNGGKSMATNGQQHMNLNEMPIYSQVQKPNTANGSSQLNGSNRNLIITNGTTNADSWV